jgi:hypothetical protein
VLPPARGRARHLLAAAASIGPGLAAFFGCVRYAAMRPGEAVSLRRACCGGLLAWPAAATFISGKLIGQAGEQVRPGTAGKILIHRS